MSVEKILALTLIVTSVLAVGGCSEGSQRKYDAAGSHVVDAAKETGHAISEDVSKAGNKVSDEVDITSRTNDELSDKIQDALLKSRQINSKDLSVSTSGQRVTLRGEVGSEVENQQAEQIARKVAGNAYSVDDQLKVNTGSQNE